MLSHGYRRSWAVQPFAGPGRYTLKGPASPDDAEAHASARQRLRSARLSMQLSSVAVEQAREAIARSQTVLDRSRHLLQRPVYPFEAKRPLAAPEESDPPALP